MPTGAKNPAPAPTTEAGKETKPRPTAGKVGVSPKPPANLNELGRQLLDDRMKTFFRELTRVRTEWSPDSIHDLRVGCRRLRSCLRAFRKFLEPAPASVVEKCLKEFMQAFNDLRDVDVQLELLDGLNPPKKKGLLFAFGQIREELQARKHELDKRLQAYVAGKTEIESIPWPDLVDATTGLPCSQAPALVLVPEIAEADRRYRLLTWELPVQEIPLLHSLRIQIKRVRYGFELFRPILGKPVESLLSRFKLFQDLLGWIHDLDAFAERVKRLIKRTQKRKFQEFREAIENLPWPVIPRFPADRGLRGDAREFTAMGITLLKQVASRRRKLLARARRALLRMEKLQWTTTLPEWLNTGKIPRNWKEELRHDFK